MSRLATSRFIRPDGHDRAAPARDDGIHVGPVIGERIAPEAEEKRLRAEIAGYIAFMTAEMATMARKADFELLTYFLEMARIEANTRAQRP